MKVKELIAKLQKLDQEALVLHRGYEDGYDAASSTVYETHVVSRIDSKWYNGKFEVASDSPDEYEKEHYDYGNPIKAVII